MADTTTIEDELAREEAADRLQEIARELRSDGPADVQVGNKTLTLTPASVLEFDLEIEERSPMLGGDREELTISLGWAAQADEQ